MHHYVQDDILDTHYPQFLYIYSVLKCLQYIFDLLGFVPFYADSELCSNSRAHL